MKLSKVLQEEKIVTQVNHYSPVGEIKRQVKIYLNPTKEELIELYDSFDEHRRLQLRFMAYMPSLERRYLYVWKAIDAYHQELHDKLEINDFRYSALQTGYGSVLAGGRLVLENVRVNGGWEWLEKYT